MKLALFFTTGISLKIWEQNGNLERELQPYRLLGDTFSTIYLITYGGKEELTYQKNLPGFIHILPNKWAIPAKIYSFLIPWLYRRELKEVDVYKTNQLSGSWAAVIAKWWYGKKLVVRCGYELLWFLEQQGAGVIKRKVIECLEKIAYRTSDAIVVAAEGDKEFIMKRFSIVSEKIRCIPNYIDTALFKPLSVSKLTKTLIFVGRLTKQKNLENLIRALSKTEYQLILIGSGSLKQELEKLAHEVNTQVIFKGNIPNKHLPEELNKAQIFILPSWYEGCPKTLLEAMSCGLPCIGTNVVGIREVITPDYDGILCDTKIDSLRDAIIRLFNSIDVQKKIGQEARTTIVQRFSLEECLKKEKELYQRIR